MLECNWEMRPLMIVLVSVALGIAGVTAFLARSFLNQPAPAASTPADPSGVQRVLVAAREISAGAIVVEEDLRFEDWPAHLVDKRFLVHAGVTDPRAKVLGSTAARRILAGEPLSGASVFRQDQAGQLSGMLGPGMRAVSIAISPTNAVAGFVTPGDRVDVVLLTQFSPGGDRGRATEKLKVTETLLRNVRVVAIDNNVKTGGVAAPGKTATLEVMPRDAEALLLAGATGTLYLVLRSQTAGESLERDGLHNNVAASKAMQTYSSLAPRMGFFGAPEGLEGSGDISVELVRRSVKLNRAGIIEIRNFAN